jgi:hypothetical protein
MAYDPTADRLILVAGTQTFSYDLVGTPLWTKLAVGGAAPEVNLTAGGDHVFIDAAANRAVYVNTNMAVFTLDLSAPTGWVRLNTLHVPPARSWGSMAFDDTHRRVFVFGGNPCCGLLQDVWILDLNGTPDFTQVLTAGIQPSPRWGAGLVYDTTRDRLIVVGGAMNSGSVYGNDVWALSMSGTPTWQQIAATGTPPSSRMLFPLVYDSPRDRIVLFGGYPGNPTDTWQLDLAASGAWTALALSPVPTGRWSTGYAFRSSTPTMLVFGGFNGTTALNDLWGLSLGSALKPPKLTSFSPLGGIAGDAVTLTGENLQSVTEVRFHGVTAPVNSKSTSTILTQVPVGATTGPITVFAPLGNATSSGSFVVAQPPSIVSVSPESARAGETITIVGTGFTTTSRVSVGNDHPQAFQVFGDTTIVATLDSVAITGHIIVVAAPGTGTSPFFFQVLQDDPRPHLLSVRDVKDDQGGNVVLKWRASDYDKPRYKTITGYRIWRRAPLGNMSASSVGHTGAALLRRRSVSRTGGADFWEHVADLPAAFLPGYAYVASTLRDSSATSNPYTAFFVEAITADLFTFYESNVDSAYSVDDLSPPTPTPFAAIYGRSANTLHWKASRAADFAQFRLYRGASTGFTPSAQNLIYSGPDTTVSDGAGAYVYKLLAMDIHGNSSHLASVGPDSPIAALASFVRAEPLADRIGLLWYASGNPALPVTVYRRTPATEWAAVASVLTDGEGFVHFTDTDVTVGQRYGYRLGIRDAGVEAFAAEIWVAAVTPAAALSGIGPNPAHANDLRVRFSLAGLGAARLTLFDISGRRVVEREVGSFGIGPHEVNLADGQRLEAGIYLVRFSEGGQSATARAVVVH